MKTMRILLTALLTAALAILLTAPVVRAESADVPEVTTITVFRPNLGEEDYMGLQPAEGDVVWAADDTMRVNLLHIPSGELLLDEWADYCTEFSGGYAGFFRDGHVWFVDAEGHVQETSFVSVKESRIDGYFEVQTAEGVTVYYQPERNTFMELTIEDVPGAWNTLLEKRGRNLFVRKIHPTSEEVLAVADIAVRAYQEKNRQYLPFLVQYDSEADVWLVYYAGFDKDGDMILGGWNIAVDAKNLQVLRVWSDE